MSWRQKLGIPKNDDISDTTIASVTSVTSSPYASAVGDLAPAPDPERPEFVHARGILNRAGCRIIVVDGTIEFGILPDQDGPELRAALRTLRHDQRVRHLDEREIPTEYRERRVAGETASVRVLPVKEHHPTEPVAVHGPASTVTNPDSKRLAARASGLFRGVAVLPSQIPAAPAERSTCRTPADVAVAKPAELSIDCRGAETPALTCQQVV